MKKLIFTLLTFVILLLVGCPTETESSEETKEPISYDKKDINYNTAHSECVMDIYRSADEVRPVVMLIHGGAWITIPGMETSLGRSGMVDFKDQFLNNGYHVVNIDYRLIKLNISFNLANLANTNSNNPSSLPTVDDSPNDVDYEDMLDDIKAAVKFLYDNSDDYKIDTSKIVMYGYSAGAHLAELYSYKVTNSPIPVKLCVGRAGPSDFWNEEFRGCEILNTFTNSAAAALHLSDSSVISSFAVPMLKSFFKVSADASDDLLEDTMRCWIITNLLGIETDVTSNINAIVSAEKNKKEEDTNYKSPITEASPITYVTSSSPRTILLHGREDHLVPYSMATSLAEELGTKCELFTMPHSGHSLDDPQDSAELSKFNNKVLQVLNDL